MAAISTSTPAIVSAEEWTAARLELLAEEKALSKATAGDHDHTHHL